MSVKGWAEAQRHEGGIIKYLYDKVKALDTASGGDESDIAAIKAAIGTDDTTAGGLKKRCADIETAIGASTSGSETGLHKDIKDINTAIGDPADPAEGTILARLAALEAKE